MRVYCRGAMGCRRCWACALPRRKCYVLNSSLGSHIFVVVDLSTGERAAALQLAGGGAGRAHGGRGGGGAGVGDRGRGGRDLRGVARVAARAGRAVRHLPGPGAQRRDRRRARAPAAAAAWPPAVARGCARRAVRSNRKPIWSEIVVSDAEVHCVLAAAAAAEARALAVGSRAVRFAKPLTSGIECETQGFYRKKQQGITKCVFAE